MSLPKYENCKICCFGHILSQPMVLQPVDNIFNYNIIIILIKLLTLCNVPSYTGSVQCSKLRALCNVQSYGLCAMFKAIGSVQCSKLRALCNVQSYRLFAMFKATGSAKCFVFSCPQTVWADGSSARNPPAVVSIVQ